MSSEDTAENYFCVRHKNRKKHNKQFKLLFFKIWLHFGTIYNIVQNICRLIHVSTQFPLTSSEKELDYYLKKVNVQVAYKFQTT